MYPFSTFPQVVTPALRGHLDAQLSFADDLFRSMFSSFEKLCGLNLQTLRTALEATSLKGNLPRTERSTEIIAAIAGGAKPVIAKWGTYQREVSRLAVDAQIELAHVMKEHSMLTSRTAHTLSDEVARTASEEIERSVRTQRDAIDSCTETFIEVTDGPDSDENISAAEQGKSEANGSVTHWAGPSHTDSSEQAN